MNELSIIDTYEFIAGKIEVGLCAIDEYGQLMIYNKKMQDILGETKEQLTQRLVTQTLDCELEDNILQKVLISGEIIKNKKDTFWNKNGEEITIISDYYPLNLENNKKIAIQIARDISHQEFLVDRPLSRYGEPLTFDTITAVSNSMKHVIQKAKIAALGRIPVLLVGESGTGKDMIAEGIHYALEEKNDRFITLICRRNEDTLLSQIEKYIGESVNYTFFAERIEFISMPAQERIVELLQSNMDRNHVFIASIGSDPVDLINKGVLSKTLYYLFSDLTIQVPALRERVEDIQPFVQDYLSRRRLNYGVNIKGLSSDVENLFLTYDWPGNLKELEVLLDDICSLVTVEEYIEMSMLPAYFKWKFRGFDENESSSLFNFKDGELEPLDEYMRKVEDYYISHALKINKGNISQAAKTLGLHRQGLQYRLRRR